MNPNVISAIVGVIGVVTGAAITGAFQLAKNKADTTKTSAEANEIIRKTVMELIEPLNKRIDSLEIELADWKDWANRLVTQLEEHCIEPVPFKSSKRK